MDEDKVLLRKLQAAYYLLAGIAGVTQLALSTRASY